jgi:hydrogenase nickel incorporation protein HypB
VGHAVSHLELSPGALLVIENVGNLVCPAAFDLGESHRVVVLSTAEGDDKVEKYPIAFRGASAVVISKMDLLEHVDFSLEHCRAMIRALSPVATIFEVSARKGEGLDALCDWVRGLGPSGA